MNIHSNGSIYFSLLSLEREALAISSSPSPFLGSSASSSPGTTWHSSLLFMAAVQLFPLKPSSLLSRMSLASTWLQPPPSSWANLLTKKLKVSRMGRSIPFFKVSSFRFNASPTSSWIYTSMSFLWPTKADKLIYLTNFWVKFLHLTLWSLCFQRFEIGSDIMDMTRDFFFLLISLVVEMNHVFFGGF